MKPVYRKVKVVFNGSADRYEVWYKTFLFWQLDEVFGYDKRDSNLIHYCDKEGAEKRAIVRANGLLETVIVYEKSTISLH